MLYVRVYDEDGNGARLVSYIVYTEGGGGWGGRVRM